MVVQSLGPYRIVEKIGEGGMGVVYRARDARLRRDVALKFLPESLAVDSERLGRFEREAQVLASLNHPNIGGIYGVESADDAHALVLEFVEGEGLDERVGRGPMPPDEVISIARQLTAALAAAHDNGVVHSDLKPANVKITPEGRVKILDFGLSRSVQPKSPSQETATDLDLHLPGPVGTLPYMAPEQLRAESVDARTDVYALGVLLYEMLAGQHPFQGASGARLVGDIQHCPPPSLRSIAPKTPRRLESVVLRCQAKEPADRFRSMPAVDAALAAAADPDADRTLAVLYLENLGGRTEDEYFRDGMTEDIIIELSKIGGLSVLPRSSVLAFRDRTLAAEEAGRQLDVSYVLDGSVRRAGDRLRVTVQLVETRNGRSVWAERYDRLLEDVFAIQDEIARSIARALRVMLSEAEKQALARVPTTNVEAYQLFLKGQQYFRQFRWKSIEFAIGQYSRAIEVDPHYAAAYAGLADCHSYLYMFWAATDENQRCADQASRTAVELDPELAEAYVSRGVAISLGKRHEEAGREFETAIRLNPQLFEAYYFYARGHYARGNQDQAVHWFRRACEVRPEDYQAPCLLASMLRGLGRREESDAAYRIALARAKDHLELQPGETRAIYFSAISLSRLGGHKRESLELAARALAMDPDEPQVLYNVGCLYALEGQADRALDCLAKTVAHGRWWKIWMANDPDLVSLRGDPRFHELTADD